ncbi:uncharacterized protein LOC113316548 [Papaver somniferum]|uniref:uncharacterized protein LOC113316548 n=1 Tax=Papaver somniferum TaxID=3469 RepID=UPI000E6F479F|nr:uncharacterized protein LOC113316548 [Papaver somniferum]XP_026420499.1 uncharacterized protein LOC113316548 [Papaver somniferum]XP_026420502.1 uncharacterized protein LOC113316548 [Papaver somniferum]XP_026420506.1 uncharacterized protein LOC113316548 [Papaver somniferum]
MEVLNGDALKDYIPSSSKFKWRIEKVSELNQEDHFSPTFFVGHCKWRLLAVRRGSNVDDYLSVYVVADGWTESRYAKFSLSVVGQANNTFKKDTEGQILHFTKEENNWGFDEFIRFNELTHPTNGYIVNDACIIEVELCSFSKQDSKEELVPVEFIEVESHHSGMEFPYEKTKKRKELEEDNVSSVPRKRPAVDRAKPKEEEKAIESGEEAIQDEEQVIESGEEAIQEGELVIESGGEATQDADQVIDSGGEASQDVDQVIDSGEEATEDAEQVIDSGEEATEDAEQVIDSGKEAIQDGEQVIDSGEEAVKHGVTGKWLGEGRRFSRRLRAAREEEKAAGSGGILNGKEVAEIGKENKMTIDESTSSENSESEKQPAKSAKKTTKKKVSKAIKSGKEATQDGEQVIECGKETIKHGKQVIEKWPGESRRFSRRIAGKEEKAAGSGEILNGKEAAENGKENTRIIEESTSSENRESEKQPAKKAKKTLKKKVSKANKGKVLSQPSKKGTFRAGFTCLWSLIKRIYETEKLSFSKEQLKVIQSYPFGNIFMAVHETRDTHSKYHWHKTPDACNKMLKWYVRGPGKKEHYFVFEHRGKEYKLISTSEKLAVIFGMPHLEGREEFVTTFDKSYLETTYFASSTTITKLMLENHIVRLVKSGEKNEDLVRLIGAYMCQTLFFTTQEGYRLNKQHLKLLGSPEKNSLSWPDLIHDHLMESIDEHKDDKSRVNGCVVYLLILFAEHIKSGVQKTPIAQGLPRLARWNLKDISNAIQTDFESLEISENFIEAYSDSEKQILNSTRMQQPQQDELLPCEAEQQNEVVVMQEEVQSTTLQGDGGVANVDQDELLVLEKKYDDLRMSIKKKWDKKEMKKSNAKTVHYEVEELLNELYFQAYPDEKKKKSKMSSY